MENVGAVIDRPYIIRITLPAKRSFLGSKGILLRVDA